LSRLRRTSVPPSTARTLSRRRVPRAARSNDTQVSREGRPGENPGGPCCILDLITTMKPTDITFSPDEMQRVLDVIENPPAPNAALRKAFERQRESYCGPKPEEFVLGDGVRAGTRR